MQSIRTSSNSSVCPTTPSASSGLASSSSHYRPLVNLAATFNDHITCTKLICKNDFSRAQLRLLGYEAFIDQSHTKSYPESKSQSISRKTKSATTATAGKEDSFEFDQLKVEIQSLKNMILAHLDLIQNQQEQLLKKDRQLQNFRHDRQLLISRISRMQRDLDQFRTSQVILTGVPTSFSPNDLSSISLANSPATMTSQGLSLERLSLSLPLPVQNLLSRSDVALSPIASNESTLQSGCNKCSPFLVKPIKTSVSGLSRSQLSSFGNTCSTNSISDQSVSVTRVDKAETSTVRASKVSTELEIRPVQMKKISSKNSAKSNAKQCDSDRTNELALDEVKSPKKRKLSKSSLTAPIPSKKIDTRLADSIVEDTTPTLNLSSMETETPYNLITNLTHETERHDECCPLTANEANGSADSSECGNKVAIEIPSWRLHPITSCYSLEGTENLNDEVFNRRHAKFEIDEKRRKRWDMQRIRELKLNERLRSGRYSKGLPSSTIYSSTNPPQPDFSNETSFYPEPKDAEYIEVSDRLPVVAFGHPIPKLPETYFTLPWNRTTTPSSPTSNKKSA